MLWRLKYYFKTDREIRVADKRKKLVWKKDLGKLVECGFIINLHYYYTNSFPKSGFSSTSYNVQLLYNECT